MPFFIDQPNLLRLRLRLCPRFHPCSRLHQHHLRQDQVPQLVQAPNHLWEGEGLPDRQHQEQPVAKAEKRPPPRPNESALDWMAQIIVQKKLHQTSPGPQPRAKQSSQHQPPKLTRLHHYQGCNVTHTQIRDCSNVHAHDQSSLSSSPTPKTTPVPAPMTSPTAPQTSPSTNNKKKGPSCGWSRTFQRCGRGAGFSRVLVEGLGLLDLLVGL